MKFRLHTCPCAWLSCWKKKQVEIDSLQLEIVTLKTELNLYKKSYENNDNILERFKIESPHIYASLKNSTPHIYDSIKYSSDEPDPPVPDPPVPDPPVPDPPAPRRSVPNPPVPDPPAPRRSVPNPPVPDPPAPDPPALGRHSLFKISEV